MKEDFSCLNPSRVVKGYGVINKIEHDYIQARNSDGRNMKFKLGTCTRLESTEDIPKVGQHFFYSAVPSYNGYQLYSGSCVWYKIFYWNSIINLRQTIIMFTFFAWFQLVCFFQGDW